jgi:phosphoribosylanthranilate isomerase
MWVKICGITRREDALLAARLGASAVGFVFWPGSRRFIKPIEARAIARSLPALVTAVGVFVDQPLEHVEAIARLVGLGAVQLHGAESAEYCSQLTAPIIKAVPVGEGFRLSTIADLPPAVTILLDAADSSTHGGTGRTIDWAMASQVARTRRAILAGGLTPANVADAIRAVRPYGVDVSSGVELFPGVKHENRLRRFFEALRTSAVGVNQDGESD